MVKAYVCKAAEWVTREAMQIHGGMGYAEEFDVSRYFVDARVLSIFEGADERSPQGHRPPPDGRAPARSTATLDRVLTDALPRRGLRALPGEVVTSGSERVVPQGHRHPIVATGLNLVHGAARASSDGHPLPRSITRSPSAVSHSVRVAILATRETGLGRGSITIAMTPPAPGGLRCAVM